MDIIYEALKKIPGVTDSQAHEVANQLSRKDEAVTKEILEASLAAQKADIKESLTWRMVIIGGIIIGVLKFWP